MTDAMKMLAIAIQARADGRGFVCPLTLPLFQGDGYTSRHACEDDLTSQMPSGAATVLS